MNNTTFVRTILFSLPVLLVAGSLVVLLEIPNTKLTPTGVIIINSGPKITTSTVPDGSPGDVEYYDPIGDYSLVIPSDLKTSFTQEYTDGAPSNVLSISSATSTLTIKTTPISFETYVQKYINEKISGVRVVSSLEPNFDGYKAHLYEYVSPGKSGTMFYFIEKPEIKTNIIATVEPYSTNTDSNVSNLIYTIDTHSVFVTPVPTTTFTYIDPGKNYKITLPSNWEVKPEANEVVFWGPPDIAGNAEGAYSITAKITTEDYNVVVNRLRREMIGDGSISPQAHDIIRIISTTSTQRNNYVVQSSVISTWIGLNETIDYIHIPNTNKNIILTYYSTDSKRMKNILKSLELL